MTIVTVKAEIEIPRVPNFLRTTSGQLMPLSAFEEAGLRAMGAEWIENLVRRAKEQREDAKNA